MDGRKLTNIFLGIIVTIAIAVVLKLVQVILKPFLIAVFLSYLAEPLVRFLKIKLNIPRPLSIIVVLLIAFVTLTLVGLLIYTSVDSFSSRFPIYENKIKSLVNSLIPLLNIPDEDVDSYLKSLNWYSFLNRVSVTRIISSSIGTFFNFIINLVLVLIFLIYAIAGKELLGKKIGLAFSKTNTDLIINTMSKINKQIERYIAAKIVVSFIEAFLITSVLVIFDVDLALFWGFLTFIMGFIPNIGSVISTIPPIAVSFFQYGTFFPPVLILLLISLIQMINGNLVEPRIMGMSLNLSPLVVLVSLIFWGWLWGPVGAVLAVPVTATLKIILENIQSLKPVSVFLTGKIQSK